MKPRLSVIIPAFNEQSLIGGTLAAISRARMQLPQPDTVEVILVDNGSVDRTVDVAGQSLDCLQIAQCRTPGAACARNWGAGVAQGDILVFVDADTLVPEDLFVGVLAHCDQRKYEAGLCRLAPQEGGIRACLWWWFWNQVRCLPLARAKACPALMFCTRAVFDELGPFDERVAIGEEWPILAGLYRMRPERLVYDRRLVGRTSNRRMERRAFGYCRTFSKWVWAVVAFRGRVHYQTDIR